MRMSKEATREYILRMRRRYEAMKSKRAKGRILDEFCTVTELSRKHAIKVLGNKVEPLRRSGRKAVYGPETAQALTQIWLTAGQPCSKLFKPMMRIYQASYERAHGQFSSEVRDQLMKVSESSIDRLLRPARIQSPRRRRSPAGVAAVKREVPIRAGEWNVSEPGWIESDTVAHCGGNMAGNFVWSLTMTDIHTQWTEIRAMWNRGAAGAFARIQEIEQALPFRMKGFDSDNGPEFMNFHLLRYFQTSTPTVSFTRSRAYMKNDNAHVEQKNGTHVRGLLGHDRIEDAECVDGLNQALILWSLWKNLYSPVRKLISKTRLGHRYRKKYDEPKTPAQRVLECDSVSEEQKDRFRALLATTDCFTLKRQVEESLRAVFAGIQERARTGRRTSFPGSGTSALRAAPSGTVPEPGKDVRERAMDEKRMVS